MTPVQYNALQKTANTLFVEGTPSSQFCRILSNDYQVICNADIETDDNFYCLTSEGNKPIRDLLNDLGYQYTTFGITIMHPSQKKNREIAKMLEWYQVAGHHQDTWFKRTDTAIVVASQKLDFDTNANSLFDAIEWVENKFKISFTISKKAVGIMPDSDSCFKYSIRDLNSQVNKKQAIFDTLFIFSQYLKTHTNGN